MSRTVPRPLPRPLDRTVRRVAPADVEVLDDRCAGCPPWSGPGRGDLVRDGLADGRLWGRVARVDGAYAGHVLLADPALVPGVAAYATAPVAGDAAVLVELVVAPGRPGTGRQLVERVLADTLRDHPELRAVEAFGARSGAHACRPGADRLERYGFRVRQPHRDVPRLRLDLGSTLPRTAALRDEVGTAWGRLVGSLAPGTQQPPVPAGRGAAPSGSRTYREGRLR